MSVSSYTESDDEGIMEIEEQLTILSNSIESLLESVESFEKELATIERPIGDIALAQLGDVPYLVTSPFRTATFAFCPPGLPGIELSRRYAFREICELLRTYLFKMNMIDADETVRLNTILKHVFQIEDDSIPYIKLIGKLRNVLI
jgi:hypothetical protein